MKPTRTKALIIVIAAVILAGVVAWGLLGRSKPRAVTFQSAVLAGESVGFSTDGLDAVLKAHVDDRGMVYYQGLKANRSDLDSFGAQLARLEQSDYDSWSEKQRVAFWTNAYNGLTLAAIVSHYPIKASVTKSLVYPKNSIRQSSW